MLKEVRCPGCAEIYKPDDTVILDEVNTMHHPECYDRLFEAKDLDTFEGIVEKYEFFHDLLPEH
ncbi:hypothetical protein [Metabacillus malikii]|uniref:LIM zinc-binding domain-containing protein n=1 Tax=Metabacillus malikii TaxID=1504265 RepID=A0ABT9ZKE6_9BACI|nr:hypothetical protein [Metabacillus malikii]MDQ0232767.1 hypothetical protein [Metabacillus malikii]